MKTKAYGLKSALLVIVLFFSFSTTAFAENVPTRETAGSEESRFREEKLYQEKLKSAEEVKEEFIEKKEEPAVTQYSGTRFLVKDVKILGNYSFTNEELRPLVADLIGHEVTLGEVKRVVGEIKQFYRDKGFIATYVYTPPQQVEEGVLKIDIMEGRLGALKISGNKWFKTELLQKMFRLKSGEILRYDPLRRDLARLAKNPDIQAKAVLGPGAETGTSDLEIQVEDKAPYHLIAEVNHSGTKNTGYERYSLSAEHTNLFGRMDDFTSALQLGEHVTALAAGYTMPIQYDWGTKLGYSFSYADVEVAGDFEPLDVKGTAQTHSLFILQPLVETEKWEATLRFGFDAKSVQNELLGQVSGTDQLRILNAGVDLEESDASGKMLSSHGVYFGLDGILGASDKVEDEATRQGTGGQFFAYRASFIRFQKLPHDLLGSLRLTGQASPSSLAPSEQFALGGSRSIRGYQEGDYLGDYGISGSVDVYIPFFFLPEDWKLPNANENLKKQLQLIAFADVGTAGLKEPVSGEVSHREMAGIGAGIRMHLFDKFYGRLEWGFPVGDRPLDNRNSAFYFTVSYEIL